MPGPSLWHSIGQGFAPGGRVDKAALPFLFVYFKSCFCFVLFLEEKSCLMPPASPTLHQQMQAVKLVCP